MGMKLRLMIEIDLKNTNITEPALFELQEQRRLSLLGLVDYMRTRVAQSHNLPINFALKVTEEDK